MSKSKTNKPKPAKNKTAEKRNRLTFDKVKTTAKASLKPAGFFLAGAVGGGLAGAALPPLASGLGGAVCIFAGIYAKQGWLAAAGASMLTSTGYKAFSGGSNQRTSGDGIQARLTDAKDRAIDFAKTFAGKFLPAKEEGNGGLSGLGDPHLLLDDIERQVEASALEHQGTARILPAPPGTLPQRPGLPGSAPNFHRY